MTCIVNECGKDARTGRPRCGMHQSRLDRHGTVSDLVGRNRGEAWKVLRNDKDLAYEDGIDSRPVLGEFIYRRGAYVEDDVDGILTFDQNG